MDALKQIEEKYPYEVPVQANLKKLARALAQFVRAVKYTSGVSLEFATKEAERVLREVAGENP